MYHYIHCVLLCDAACGYITIGTLLHGRIVIYTRSIHYAIINDLEAEMKKGIR